MQTTSNLFESEMRKALEVMILDKAESVSLGRAPSFDEYRWQAGVIQGLKEALGVCDDVNSKLSQR